MDREIINVASEEVSEIGEKIRLIRSSRKMTQKAFSASLGIVQGFLCAIERGKKSPSATLLIALQYLYGINPLWLTSGTGGMYLETKACLPTTIGRPTIPLLKAPPASLDIFSAAMIQDYILIPDVPKDCFAFECTGDFMAPTIRGGDVVIVQPSEHPQSGDVILLEGQWGDSLLRRYRVRGNEVFCSADNSSYAPFKPSGELKILGIVHAVWRKIKI